MSEQILKYERPDSEGMIRQSGAMLTFAQGLLIDSPDTNQMAGEELASIKGKLNKLDALRKSITKPMDDAKAAVMDLFRAPVATLQDAERTIKNKMLAYTSEQERIAEQRRRAAEAVAQQERDRLAAEAAETERLAQEEAAKLLESADGPANEETVQQAQAVMQQAQETAAALRSSAAVMTAPIVSDAPSRASGTAVKEVWKATVDDKLKLIQHVAANPHLVNLLDINQTALNQMAKSLKSGLNIPGASAYPERSLSSRAA